MWPFQRKTEVPADSGSRPAPAPVVRRDWTGLPPIQRLIGAHPLTAPSDRFRDDLATHHDPSVSTEPMGHQISAEAPAGIVLALARPTTRHDGPAMISRPRVQRRVQRAMEESGEWDGDEAAPPATRPSPLPAGTPTNAVRELPAVAPAPVAQRLTTLPPDVEPMPVERAARRSRIEPSPDLPVVSRGEAPEGTVAPLRLTLGQARRLGLGAPINRVPDRAVQRATAGSADLPLAPYSPPRPSSATGVEQPSQTEASVPSPVEMSSAQRLELPLVPRPMAPHADPPVEEVRPVSDDAPVQRAIEISAEPPTHGGTDTFADVIVPQRTELSEAMPSRPIVQRIPQAGAAPKEGMEFSAVDAPALPLVQRTLQPDPPPQGGREIPRAPTLPSPASQGGELWASPASGAGDLRESSPARVETVVPTPSELPPAYPSPRPFPAGGEGAELAPLVGARPLRPTTLQRAAEPTLVTPVTESAEPLAVELPAQRDAILVPSRHDTPESVPARSPFSPELTHLATQTRFSPTLPDPAFAVPRRLQVQTQSDLPVSRVAELPLAPLPRAAAAESPEPEPGGESTSEVMQRGMFDSPSSEVTLSSRAPSPVEAGSAVSTVGSFTGSMFGGHKAPETDMDELAGKLYDKIRTQLKSELLVDRERAGLLTDLR